MLRPLKRDRVNCYSTLDIETAKDGHVLDIGVYDGSTVSYFSCWAAFIEFVKVHIEEKIYHKFIAHFGGSFDYVSFVEYLTRQTAIKYDIVMANSKIVVLYVFFGETRVEFIDSANTFLQTSLAKLCEIFKVDNPKMEGVDRGNIESEKRKDPARYYKYLGLDVISLYQVCKSFERYLEIDFFPITIASLAMYLYRRKFQKYILFKPRKPVDEFISKSYAGGRVEVFQPGAHELVHTYDINSLYPSVMRNAKFPVGTPGVALTFHPDKIGCYHVTFDQADRTIPPLLWEKNDINGLEFKYSGEGHFFDAELRLAMEHGVKIDIIKGYVWIHSVYLFREFVDYYYNLRQANRGNAMDYICKILLNSLYGKFGQKENKSVLRRLDYFEVKELCLDDNATVRPYDVDRGLYEVAHDRNINHRVINIAAQVTSLARTALNREIIKHAGTVVYCDTDSLHLKDTLPKKQISKKLGKWKAEDSGEGIYTGRKQYSIGDKVRFKGVRLVDKLAGGVTVLDRGDVALINRGLVMEKTYSYFPQVKTILKTGRKACKIYRVTKTVRKSYFQTNFAYPENRS